MFPLLFILLSLSATVRADQCNLMIAAFSLGQVDYLVTMAGLTIIDNSDMTIIHKPQTYPLLIEGQTAAVGIRARESWQGTYALFSSSVPNGYQMFSTDTGFPITHNAQLGDLSDVKVDAAFIYIGRVYILISGDQYLTVNPRMGRSEFSPLSDLRLPAYIDAAYKHEDMIVVVKGADFYTAKDSPPRLNFRGPFTFRHIYRETRYDLNLSPCEPDSS